MNDVNEVRRKLLALRRRVSFDELGMVVWLQPPTAMDIRPIRDRVTSKDQMTQGFQLAVAFLVRCGEEEDGTALFGPEDYDRLLSRLPITAVDVNETKNDEGREVPFDVVPELVRAFREQRQYTTTIERATDQICPWVFHRKGKRIKRMDIARQRACERAGVIGKDGRPKTLHDMRRTAIRRLTRAGVPRHITMRIVGLKSEAVFRRYSIVETEDLRDGFAKVLQFTQRKAAVGDA